MLLDIDMHILRRKMMLFDVDMHISSKSFVYFCSMNINFISWSASLVVSGEW